MLYHYTSADVLLKILESQRLRLSYYRFVNDKSEFQHGRELCRKHFNKVGKFTSEYFEEVIKGEKTHFELFTFSFSEEPNLLSQWRAYCPNEGYSIGFDEDSLIELTGRMGRDLSFFDCIYDREKQQSAIEAFFREWKEQADEYLWSDEFRKSKGDDVGEIILSPSENPYEQFPLTKYINDTAMLYQLIARLKDPGFKEEKESRYIYLQFGEMGRITKNKIGYYSNGKDIVPYIELPIPLKCIRQIYVGPCSEPMVKRRILRSYLKSKPATKHIKVIPSGIPYRNNR